MKKSYLMLVFVCAAVCFFGGRSSAGAVDFGTNVKVNDDSTAFDQSLLTGGVPAVVAHGGNLYAVWLDARNNPADVSSDIYFAKGAVDANGLVTFGANIRVNSVSNTAVMSHTGGPSIAVDSNGVIYVVWIDNRPAEETDVYLTRSTDGGASFPSSNEVRLDNYGSEADPLDRREPRIATADGYVYVTFGTSQLLEICTSTDNGVTFSAPVEVPGAIADESVIAADGSYVYIAQIASAENFQDYDEVFLAISANHGQSFSDFKIINDDTGGNRQSAVSIAAAGNNLYLVWRDQRDGYATYMAISQNRGASFGSNFLVSSTGGITFPCVSAYGSNVAVSYIDDRAIWAKVSYDTGQTWTQETEVSVEETRLAIGIPSITINDQITGIIFTDDGDYHNNSNTENNIYAGGYRFAEGSGDTTELGPCSCDCNGDGKTGLAEVIKILQQLAGL